MSLNYNYNYGLNIVNLTTGNLVSTNITVGNIFYTGNLIQNGTNATLLGSSNNFIATNLSAGTLNAGNLTSGNINFTGTLSQNGTAYLGSQWTTTAANLSYTSGNVIVNNLTTGNLNFTGTLSQNGSPYIGSQWTNTSGSAISYTSGNVIASNLVNSNASMGNISASNISISGNMTVGNNLLVLGSLTSVNITTVNLIDNNISAGTLNAIIGTIPNLTTTNITTNSLIATTVSSGSISSVNNTVVNLNTTNITTTNILTTGLSSTNLTSTNNTLTNTIFTNFTVGTLLANNVNLGISSLFSGSFVAANNVSTPTNVTGVIFNSTNVNYFEMKISVSIVATVNLTQTYNLYGNFNASEWSLFTNFIGDTTGVVFSITAGGQIQYTSTNVTGFVSDTFRYTVQQFSASGTYNSLVATTQGNYIFDTVQVTSTTDSVIGTSVGGVQVLGGATIAKQLNIQATGVAVGLGSGGSLSVFGGAAVSRNIIIGSGITSAFNSNTIGNIFTTGGNVGIGNANPGFTLDISGTARITGSLTTGNINVTNGTLVINSSMGNVSPFTPVSITNTNQNGIAGLTLATSNQFGFIGIGGSNYANSNTNNLFLQSSTNIILSANNVGGAPHLFVSTSNGNIGVNTSNPSFNLDVAGITRISTSLTTGSIFSTNITTTNIVGTLISSGAHIITAGGLIATFNSNTLGNLFTTAGNVGIGTSTPNAPLQFSNSLINRKIVLHELVNNDNQFNGFGINASIVRYQASDISNSHVFYAGVNSTTSNEIFRISGTGNITVPGTTNSVSLSAGNAFFTKMSTEAIQATTSTISNIVNTNISTGTLNIAQTGSSPIYITSSFSAGAGGYLQTIRAFNSIMALGEANIVEIGKSNTTINSGYFGFVYNSSGSTTNYLTMGHSGVDRILNINGSRNVGINTTAPSFTLDVAGTGRFNGHVYLTTGSLRSPSTSAALYPLVANDTSTFTTSTNGLNGIGSYNLGMVRDAGGYQMLTLNCPNYVSGAGAGLGTVSSDGTFTPAFSISRFGDTFIGTLGQNSPYRWDRFGNIFTPSIYSTFMTTGNLAVSNNITVNNLLVTTGNLIVSSSQTLPINISTSFSGAFTNLAYIFAPNQTNGNTNCSTRIFHGQGIGDNFNSGQIGFNYISNNNTSNFASFGVYGLSPTLNINGSGNVGINTTAPAFRLDVAGVIKTGNSVASNVQGYSNIILTPLTGQTATEISFNNAAGNRNYIFTHPPTGMAIGGNGALQFQTGTSAGSTATYMTLSSEGNLGIGTSAPTARLDINGQQYFSNTGAIEPPTQSILGGTGAKLTLFPGSASTATPHAIGVQGANMWYSSFFGHIWYCTTTSPSMQLTNGNLLVTGDIAGFATISDQRLKSNINSISGTTGLKIVNDMRPVTFNWREDLFNKEHAGSSDSGFIAQEIETLIPHAVSEYTDITNEERNIYKNLRHERIIPYLTAAIQELFTLFEKSEQKQQEYEQKLEQMQAEIDLLKTKINKK